MWTLVFSPADAGLARRIEQDLSAADFRRGDLVLIAVLSPQALEDQTVRGALAQAAAAGTRIIPVLAKATPLPEAAAGLDALDFTLTYNRRVLLAHVKGAPAAAVVRGANRRAAYVLVVVASVMFLAAILAIGVFGLHVPEEEYDAVNTQAAGTVQALVGENLPRTTDEARNFPATLDAAPTAQRPLLIATTTARAGGE